MTFREGNTEVAFCELAHGRMLSGILYLLVPRLDQTI